MNVTRPSREPRVQGTRSPEPSRAQDPRRQVVGVILSDGTVHAVAGPRPSSPAPRWSSGRFSGPGWELWWERRTWEES